MSVSDKYDVLFYDGYQKTQRGCKITKATEEDLKNMTVSSAYAWHAQICK